MNWLGVSYWGHRNMGGPARRVVEYNFEHYRKRGWVGRLLFVGRGLSGKWLHPWKDSPMSKNIKEGTRHGFLCLIFLQKENSIVQFAMRIFRKFCQIHFGRGGGGFASKCRIKEYKNRWSVVSTWLGWGLGIHQYECKKCGHDSSSTLKVGVSQFLI